MDKAIGQDRAGVAGQQARPARPAAKPAVAFKHAMARAFEGWGPDAPDALARRHPPAGPPIASQPVPGGAPPAAFTHLIARLESGGAGRTDAGYGARNPSSGALGRYQLLPVALRDIGWQDAAGQWTAVAAAQGVRADSEFLGNPAAQEAAMAAFLRRSETLLDRNGSLAHAGRTIAGLDGFAVPLTEAGLVAAAHRSGAGSVARYLAQRAAAPDAPVSAADRATFQAVERRLRTFADLPYQLAARRTPSAG
jgi:hypothetical protein